MGYNRNDMVHSQIADYTCFYLNLFRVSFPLHLVASFEFVAPHYVHRFEHLHGIIAQIGVETYRTTCHAIQSSLRCFGFPLIAVTISVEVDRLTGFNIVANNFYNCTCLVFTLFNQRINTLLEACQSFCHSCIQHDERRGTVGFRPYCAQFKAIAGKGKWRRTVAVGVVDEQLWNFRNVELHALFPLHGEQVFLVGFLYMFKQVGQLFSKERRNNSRWGFVCPQAVVVGCTHNRCFQQSVMFVNAHQCFYNKDYEAQIVVCVLTAFVQQHPCVGSQTPVVVLS